MKKRKMLLKAFLLCLAVNACAGVTVDFSAATGPAAAVGDITLIGIGQMASAAGYFWHGDSNFSWSVMANWSTNASTKVEPTIAPGAGDVVYWRPDAARNLYLNASPGIAAVVANEAAGSVGVWINSGSKTLTLTGTNVGVFTNAVFYNASGKSATFASGNSALVLSGGGDKVFYADSKITIQTALTETGGAANLVKEGSAKLFFTTNSSYLLAGDFTVNAGSVEMQCDLNMDTGTLSISNAADAGGFQIDSNYRENRDRSVMM